MKKDVNNEIKKMDIKEFREFGFFAGGESAVLPSAWVGVGGGD